MTRERMVTRTINETDAVCMVCNVRTATVMTRSFPVTGEVYEEKAELLKLIKTLFETDEEKIVDVISWDTKQVLYGMREIDFVLHAQIMPPRTKAKNEGDEG